MRNPVYFILWIGNVFTGLVIIFLSIPLVQRKIKMNRWYGVRLAKAYESEENWYAINRLWSRRAIRWSLAFILLTGIAAWYLMASLGNSLPLIVMYACSPIILVAILIIEALRCAKRIP